MQPVAGQRRFESDPEALPSKTACPDGAVSSTSSRAAAQLTRVLVALCHFITHDDDVLPALPTSHLDSRSAGLMARRSSSPIFLLETDASSLSRIAAALLVGPRGRFLVSNILDSSEKTQQTAFSECRRCKCVHRGFPMSWRSRLHFESLRGIALTDQRGTGVSSILEPPQRTPAWKLRPPSSLSLPLPSNVRTGHMDTQDEPRHSRTRSLRPRIPARARADPATTGRRSRRLSNRHFADGARATPPFRRDAHFGRCVPRHPNIAY